ncbi:MAG: sodium:proton antiporter [Clostridiales bacterium]|nr:sodium:proton antiporter [Clostridiales bacterium]
MDFWFAMLLFIGALVGCLVTGAPIAAAILAGLLAFWAVARHRGFEAKALFRMALRGGKETFGVVRILILIGLVTASWRASGTIAVFIDMGLSIITPSLFIFIAFLLSLILSYAMGTCFGVVGTVGVIFMALARSGGVNEFYTAGAILSGAFFGDRCAPLSSSANLVAGVTDTSLYDNIKYMHLTALLPLGISVVLYFILSAESPIGTVDTAIVSELAANFDLSWWGILPTAIMLILPICRIPLRYAIPASVLMAGILAVVLQDMPILSFLRCCILGYTMPDPALDRILGGGGVVSMLSVCFIVLFSGMLSGIFNGTGMLGGLHSIIRPLEVRIGGFPAMILTSIVICATFCNQTLAITMNKELWEGIYEEEHASHRELAIDMENSAIFISGLIPWAVTCSVPLEMLGVDAHALPYGFLLYLLPLCYLFTKRIWFPVYAKGKTGQTKA